MLCVYVYTDTIMHDLLGQTFREISLNREIERPQVGKKAVGPVMGFSRFAEVIPLLEAVLALRNSGLHPRREPVVQKFESHH